VEEERVEDDDEGLGIIDLVVIEDSERRFTSSGFKIAGGERERGEAMANRESSTISMGSTDSRV